MNFISITALFAISVGCVNAAQSNFSDAYNSFDASEFKRQVSQLASDEFAGRAPASEGEQKTIDFMVSEFQALGLKPGNGDQFTQKVPLVSIETEPTTPLKIGNQTLTFKSDFVVTSSQNTNSVELKDSELVFVGYGVVAPEFGWNDYKGLDMRGKTAVILVNDPGYATQDPEVFSGKAMTYYGRWTYKYEEAARQGAAAAIIVHETAPASYGWKVVESGWTGPQFHLAKKDPDLPQLDAEMWITYPQTQSLFQQSGLDFDQLKQNAAKKGFKSVPLKINANLSLKITRKLSESHNIIATIPGDTDSDEHIIYTAHWDHLGVGEHSHENQGSLKQSEDVIYNGAHDNATGTSALLMIAKAFITLNQKPRRSITFIAVTAEEQGLLGSKHYAENPIIPLKNTVGVINMDSLNISGRMKDFRVVGFNKSELQQYLAQAAKRQNRELVAEDKPERGGFYRSDHFSLAKYGVPAIYAGGGVTYLDAQQQASGQKMAAIISTCYHQPCDEISEQWNLQSAIDDMQVFFETGWLLANSSEWPNWYEGTEFKRIRDQSRQ